MSTPLVSDYEHVIGIRMSTRLVSVENSQYGPATGIRMSTRLVSDYRSRSDVLVCRALKPVSLAVSRRVVKFIDWRFGGMSAALVKGSVLPRQDKGRLID